METPPRGLSQNQESKEQMKTRTAELKPGMKKADVFKALNIPAEICDALYSNK